MNDPINPNHYKNLKIEPIDFITENNFSYCIGNVIKYISRYENKNGVEDLKKAKWYLVKQIEIEENKCQVE